jgi:hypothetical protein
MGGGDIPGPQETIWDEEDICGASRTQAESFWARLKTELLEGGAFRSVEEARIETFSYIEGYYNRIRRHSALGYLSPDEFERRFEISKNERQANQIEKNLA